MKRALLFLAAGLVSWQSFGQTQKLEPSVVFVNSDIASGAGAIRKGSVAASQLNRNLAQKGTATTSAWFSFLDVLSSQGGVQSTSDFPVTQDTMPKVTTAANPFNWYLMGLGFSFDPKSPAYYDLNRIQNPAAIPPFKIDTTKAYTVDSVEVLGFYTRKPYNNYTDTLYIDVVATGTTKVLELQYPKSATYASRAEDSAPRVNHACYDPIRNRISDSAASVVRITKILNAAAFADSASDGYHHFKFKLPTPISVAAKRTVVALLTFKSGFPYPLNKALDSTNFWYHTCYELDGAATDYKQIAGDRTHGILATTQTRYTQPRAVSNTRITYDNFQYAAGARFDLPYFNFHVNCASCTTASVDKVTPAIAAGAAYPNPANTTLTVPVVAAAAAEVSVILSTPTGQVVASQNLGRMVAGQQANAIFNTAALASGLYFYTVEAAGQRSTQRVVVGH